MDSVAYLILRNHETRVSAINI